MSDRGTKQDESQGYGMRYNSAEFFTKTIYQNEILQIVSPFFLISAIQILLSLYCHADVEIFSRKYSKRKKKDIISIFLNNI